MKTYWLQWRDSVIGWYDVKQLANKDEYDSQCRRIAEHHSRNERVIERV